MFSSLFPSPPFFSLPKCGRKPNVKKVAFYALLSAPLVAPGAELNV